ncbi:Fibroblast growth factor 14 [Ameca splendens]|uniref:Fibroblast growth factor 14 n=1 Tax=Ameca splendens TaxID=208324 RepID=A0ABV0Y1I5_9TELE
MAAAIASGLIRQKRQAREQHAHRPTAHRRRKSPGKKQGLCNGNLVDIFSKVRIFGLKKRRLRRQDGGARPGRHLRPEPLLLFVKS